MLLLFPKIIFWQDLSLHFYFLIALIAKMVSFF